MITLIYICVLDIGQKEKRKLFLPLFLVSLEILSCKLNCHFDPLPHDYIYMHCVSSFSLPRLFLFLSAHPPNRPPERGTRLTADAGRELVPALRPAVGQGLFAASPGLDPGGELHEDGGGAASAGGYLSVPICGGDSQLEGAAAQLRQPDKELHSQLLLVV